MKTKEEAQRKVNLMFEIIEGEEMELALFELFKDKEVSKKASEIRDELGSVLSNVKILKDLVNKL